MSNGTRPRWQQTCLEHSTRDSRRCKRKEEQHFRTKARSWVDRAARQLRPVCHEQLHLFESTLCIGCQLANKNLQRIDWVYRSSLVTQALCALLEVAEAEKARANSRNAEDMPPAHDLRPSVVEIIGKEGVPSPLHLGSSDDRSRS